MPVDSDSGHPKSIPENARLRGRPFASLSPKAPQNCEMRGLPCCAGMHMAPSQVSACAEKRQHPGLPHLGALAKRLPFLPTLASALAGTHPFHLYKNI